MIEAKFKLKRLLKELERVRGRHTELVSVYIPAGYDLNKIINQLMQEQGTAENIKDKSTKQNVIDSLEKLIRHLRLFKKTPENGLVAFSGNCSEREDKVDIKVWSIEPPKPLNQKLYKCGQQFFIEPLFDMLAHKEFYGLVIIERKEATIGILKGNSIIEITTLTSGVPGKTRAGGQCLSFKTVVDMADGQQIPICEVNKGDLVNSYDFEKKSIIGSIVLDVWKTQKDKKYLIKTKLYEINSSADHLFFLSDGTTKNAEELKKGDLLLNYLGGPMPIEDIEVSNNPNEMYDLKVENENFIAAGFVVHNSAQRFERLRNEIAKEFFNRIADVLHKEFLMKEHLQGILVGGPGPTKETFLSGNFLNQQLKDKVSAVKDIGYTGMFGLEELVEKSKDVLSEEEIIKEKKIMERFFRMLSIEQEKIVYGKEAVENAIKYGAVETLLLSEKLEDKMIDEFTEKAESIGAKTVIISLETSEGNQFKEISGIAAILRFPIS